MRMPERSSTLLVRLAGRVERVEQQSIGWPGFVWSLIRTMPEELHAEIRSRLAGVRVGDKRHAFSQTLGAVPVERRAELVCHMAAAALAFDDGLTEEEWTALPSQERFRLARIRQTLEEAEARLGASLVPLKEKP